MFIRSSIDVEIWDRYRFWLARNRYRLIRQANPLNIHILDLFKAIGHTIIVNYNDVTRWDRIFAQSIALQWFILLRSDRGNIKMSRHINRFRDFSRTSRIGEISQVLSMLYFMNDGFRFFGDVVTVCEKYFHQFNRAGRTPDFLMLNPSIPGLVLVESKGTMDAEENRLRYHLRDPDEQCREFLTEMRANGWNLGVRKHFCSVVRLSEPGGLARSKILVSDPDYYSDPDEKISLGVVKSHYKSWLILCGSIALANGLDQENFDPNEHIQNIPSRIITSHQEEFVILRRLGIEEILNPFGLTAFSPLIDGKIVDFIELSISKRALRMIFDKESESRNFNFSDNSTIRYFNSESSSIALFADDTAIVVGFK